jgi:predicted phosphate transport protein (TIGR00153 family)
MANILSLFTQLIPRESRFFDHFREMADLIVQGAKEFQELASDIQSIDRRSKSIKAIEHKADEITHRTMELLHRTFITPLDREDIHLLISRLDDILDFIEAASQRIFLYGITETTPEIVELARVCTLSAEQVQKAVYGLSNLNQSDVIIQACVEINRLENEGDQVLRAGIAKLFRDEADTRQLIKIKEIYELLETVTDRCEDVANVIEGIVLEYA